MGKPDPILELNDVRAGYNGREVLHGVSLRIEAAQCVALIGPNGSGKSTLFRAIAGSSRLLGGEIRLCGRTLGHESTDSRIRSGLGYLIQTRNVFADLTVRENLSLAANAVNSGSSGVRAEKVIAAFPQLGKLLDTRVGLLSGGQRQTLAAAMVLMRPTKCLLLDEPLAGLAPSAGLAALNAIQALQADESFPMIMAEHQLRLVQPYVRRVIVMREGRIVDDTTEVDRMLDPDWVRGHFGAQFDAASRAARLQHEQGPQSTANLPHP